jgi:hypothetical protein
MLVRIRHSAGRERQEPEARRHKGTG